MEKEEERSVEKGEWTLRNKGLVRGKGGGGCLKQGRVKIEDERRVGG